LNNDFITCNFSRQEAHHTIFAAQNAIDPPMRVNGLEEGTEMILFPASQGLRPLRQASHRPASTGKLTGHTCRRKENSTHDAQNRPAQSYQERLLGNAPEHDRENESDKGHKQGSQAPQDALLERKNYQPDATDQTDQGAYRYK
jgi:hypothetical protein